MGPNEHPLAPCYISTTMIRSICWWRYYFIVSLWRRGVFCFNLSRFKRQRGSFRLSPRWMVDILLHGYGSRHYHQAGTICYTLSSWWFFSEIGINRQCVVCSVCSVCLAGWLGPDWKKSKFKEIVACKPARGGRILLRSLLYYHYHDDDSVKRKNSIIQFDYLSL